MMLPSDLMADQQRAQRYQALAQVLAQQGQQPQGQMVSGRYVAPAVTQNLGALAAQLGSGYYLNKGEQAQQDLSQKYRQMIADALASGSASPNRMQTAQGYIASGIPELAEVGKQQLSTLDKMVGDTSFSPRSRVALAQTGDIGGLTATPSIHTVNDQMVAYNPDTMGTTQVGDFRPTYGPVQNVMGEAVQFEQGTNKPVQTATRPPQTNVSLGENEVDKAAAGKIIDQLIAGRNTLQGARSMNATADRLMTLLQDPNVITGFGQDTRAGLANAAQLMFPGDSEALAKTQQAIRETANLALDSASRLKGQGQVSDAERRLLEQASGGNLNLTADALRAISATTKRIAAQQASEVEGLYKQVGSNPKYKPYTEMLQLAPYQDTQQAAPLTPDVSASPAGAGPKIINWPGASQ